MLLNVALKRVRNNWLDMFMDLLQELPCEGTYFLISAVVRVTASVTEPTVYAESYKK